MHVLIGTDGSDGARRATDWAARLALATGARWRNVMGHIARLNPVMLTLIFSNPAILVSWFKHLATQQFKVMRLAIEFCEVCRQRGHHHDALFRTRVRGQEFPVVLERIHTELAQTLRQPRIDKRRLGFRHVDAGFLVQCIRNRAKVLDGENELTLCGLT